MEPESIDVVTSAQGLAILSAILVVIYALWAEYFGQYIRQLDKEESKVNREAESEKARLAVVLVAFFEFAIYLGSPDVRQAFPVFAQLVFIISIILLIFIQSGIEKKIRLNQRKSPSPFPDAFGLAGMLARALTVWVAGTILYVLFISVIIQSLFWTAEFFHVPGPWKTIFMAIGGFLGVGIGVAFNFALSAWVLRKILPLAPLEDPHLKSQFQKVFHRVGLGLPEFWIVELEKLRLTSLTFAGFSFGRWVFRPGFFVARWLLEHLTSAEVNAIVLSQVSHVLLRHVEKRFLFSLFLIFLTSLASLLLLGLGFETLGVWVAFCFFLISLHLLVRQNKKHQLEADLYCIQKLGVPADDLISALRKKDELPPEQGIQVSQIHPETEQRIQSLRGHLKSS